MVRALCFGNNADKLLLASASKQAINVWTIFDPESDGGKPIFIHADLCVDIYKYFYEILL